ncbi:innexin shaking-B isoform X2 [Neocloeon triangulifer]|uniref:innexin shaking-B isoform X2 n=1 Tax=Neocloeon triangulifer TaxID=2078957 RepID=UPI00286EF1E1|nr:innexin shaking-B isoform X2 [Neocloeon triangulifer]
MIVEHYHHTASTAAAASSITAGKYTQPRNMLELFRTIHGLTKASRAHTCNWVFSLHCRATPAFLLAACLAVTTRQYVGNPIECLHTKDIPPDVFNTYCWIHSTYSIPSALKKKVGVEVPYPGIDNTQFTGPYPPPKSLIRQHKYYQWVSFFLFFQAILFYAPRWLWKSWEGGKIHALMMDLDVGICSEVEKKQKKKLLLDYLWDNLKNHNWWAYRYYLCELLALLNVVGQMFLMNKFFDGAFLTFGFDVIAFLDRDQEDRIDPMIFIFPRMTKCTFHKFGTSGEVERHDAVCILPLNVVNEKIYVFLWFWFLILGGLTALVVMYRCVVIVSPRMRVYLLRLRFRLIRGDVLDILVRKSKLGDWFLISMLGENVDSLIFRDVMHDLAAKLSAANSGVGLGGSLRGDPGQSGHLMHHHGSTIGRDPLDV